MANHSATKKDMRQAAKRRERNRYYGKTTRNAVRELKAGSDTKAYTEGLPNVISMIDKLAKRGIIHKNKAANLKSKLAKKAVANIDPDVYSSFILVENRLEADEVIVIFIVFGKGKSCNYFANSDVLD